MHAQTPPPLDDDRRLFEAAKAGDFDAFTAIVERFRDRVFRLAYGMTKSESESEEVVQDVFLNIFRKLEQFRGDSAPATWVYRIAANSALMYLRRKKRKPTLFIEDRPPGLDYEGRDWINPPGEWGKQPDEKLLTRELGEQIEEAVAELPEKYRLVLLLRDIEGQTNEEVSETLGLTVPTVKSRLHRSRVFVRERLERYLEGKN